MSASAEREVWKKKLKALWADNRTYRKRMLLAGSALPAACFTFIFFGPLEMVAFSGSSFMFTYKDVLWLLIGAAAVVFVIGTLLVSLLRGKIFNYVVSCIFAFTVCGYLQATFLNGSVGILSGETVEWARQKGDMMISLVAWGGILVLVFFVMYLHREIWRKMVMLVSLLLVAMQLAPTVGILAGAFDDAVISEIAPYSLTEEGLTQFSSEENIFLFVVDYTDFDYIEQVLEEDPDFFDSLDGFTGYTDAISTFGRTRPALCNILTGHTEGAYRVSNATYFREAWNTEEGNVFDVLKAEDYTIELYTSIADVFSDPEAAVKYVSNVSRREGEMNTPVMLKKLMYLSAYRYAPIMMKPFFWEYTDFYNQDVYETVTEKAAYSVDDIRHGVALESSTADREEKSFKLYHFDGAHPPCYLNPDGSKSDTQTDPKSQTMGCFTLLKGAFDRMKELGIYEDATIIITADHGNASKEFEGNFTQMRIALFYKPSGSAGTPLAWSDAQVSTDNIPATIAKAVGAEYAQFGRALDDIGEAETVEREFIRVVIGPETEERVETYKIKGDAGDFSNWEMTQSEDVLYSFY